MSQINPAAGAVEPSQRNLITLSYHLRFLEAILCLFKQSHVSAFVNANHKYLKNISLFLLILSGVSLNAAAQWTSSGGGNYYITSGAIAVGTSANPGYKAYINGPFPLAIAGNDSTFVGADINIIRANTGNGVARAPGIQFQDNQTNYAALIQSNKGNLQFFNMYTGGWNEGMRLTNTGNLLIGKTAQSNSNYKVDVNGGVRANVVVVNTNGADFVFEQDYELLPLESVERFIKTNHHLPGVASAKDMQTNGLNLGDNQTLLLQKVEELTLYLIDKDKELKHAESVIAEQGKVLQQLQIQLKVQEDKINRLLK